jgi:hypothetical protein
MGGGMVGGALGFSVSAAVESGGNLSLSGTNVWGKLRVPSLSISISAPG